VSPEEERGEVREDGGYWGRRREGKERRKGVGICDIYK